MTPSPPDLIDAPTEAAPSTAGSTVGASAPFAKASPMMAQYLAVKKQHPDALLFYRMGDFYEMFFDDAHMASRALDIALTKRGQHQGQDIPMCGVPVHSHTGYVARLIRQGYRVAVCEQTETPEEARKRSGKTLVDRRVVRLITPGTLTEDTLLDARAHNYLLVLLPTAKDTLALAWCDISTGTFEVETVPRTSLSATLARLAPREALVPEPALGLDGTLRLALEEAGVALTVRPASLFDPANARDRLLRFYRVASPEVWGGLSDGEMTAAGALLDYLLLTQVGTPPLLQTPRRVIPGGLLDMDAATRRNLELMQTVAGEKSGSLLSVIDKTVTAAGGRLMAARLASPLADVSLITARQESVAWAVAALSANGTSTPGRPPAGADIRARLTTCPDMERALSRLTLARAGPRDLAAVGTALRVADALYGVLEVERLPADLASCAGDLTGHATLVDLLSRALKEELPLQARDGGFIATGFSPALDDVRTLRDHGRQSLLGLQARYLEETGLSSLKIRHNNIIGYHIELSATQAEKLMASPRGKDFIHRQTMAGTLRFSTPELVQMERDISQAAERALAMELNLFEDLREVVLQARDALMRLASALAAFDWALALGALAVEADWVRPVVDHSSDFRIEGGRHPVVEAALRRTGTAPFVANTCDLASTQRLWLLTGPNMAGKSTFLRQNALIAVLAHTGSYVPATRATLGLVDRLFSRVGASDDLARGRSTFMVEMVETATILTRATPRSLVILDEIGRGTATHDGLAIAWATAEHLHDINRCRTLFATHYHELRELTATLPALSCHAMRVKEWKGDIIFLHEVVDGAADRSYGLHVARLAGLPEAVIARARTLLTRFESAHRQEAGLPLFACAERSTEVSPEDAPPPATESVSPALDFLRTIDPDALTPREALEALYRLKEALTP